MKKCSLIMKIMILSLCIGFVNGQDKSPNSAENGETTSAATKISRVYFAYQAAKYGREYGSADALILAASILKSVSMPDKELGKQVEGGQPDATQKKNQANLTVDIFLKEARILAKNDLSLLGRINAVSKMRPPVQGALGGPKKASTEVRAYATDVIQIQFKGGENAVVAVSGDGDTDLDLYVYDENNNLIGSDTTGLDDCKVRFFPKWSGTFYIKVKNLGNVYNKYVLLTN